MSPSCTGICWKLLVMIYLPVTLDLYWNHTSNRKFTKLTLNLSLFLPIVQYIPKTVSDRNQDQIKIVAIGTPFYTFNSTMVQRASAAARYPTLDLPTASAAS